MQVPQTKGWVIKLSNHDRFIVDEKTKEKVVELVDSGIRLICIDGEYLNPSFIQSILRQTDDIASNTLRFNVPLPQDDQFSHLTDKQKENAAKMKAEIMGRMSKVDL